MSVRVLEVQPTDLDLAGVRERMAPQTERVAELLRRYPVKRAALLQVLWLIQEEFGWIPRVSIRWAAEVCEVAPVHAFAVVEFYTMYKQIPPARYHIRVCQGVSCHIQGAEELIAHLEQKLGIRAGEHTEDALFALERVECLAACGNGPAVQVNDDFLFGSGELNQHQDGWHPDAASLDAWIDRLREQAAQQPELPRIDELGGILVGSAGHPGACGAAAEDNPPDYAPPPPALNPAASIDGQQVTVRALCAPEVTWAVLERQNGVAWLQVGECDPRQISGPPGPKQVAFSDHLGGAASACYRVIASSGERIARPSAAVAIDAQATEEQA